MLILSEETSAKSITKAIVMLKTRLSTPRRVLNTEPALLPPKALPSPAPRTCNKIKKITDMLRIICTIRIAGSHAAKVSSSLWIVAQTISVALYHTMHQPSRHKTLYLAYLSHHAHVHAHGMLGITQQSDADYSDPADYAQNEQCEAAIHHTASHIPGKHSEPARSANVSEHSSAQYAQHRD